MSTQTIAATLCRWLALVLVASAWCPAPRALAQSAATIPSVSFHVTDSSERLEMVVNSSRILTLDHKVPRALVHNPDVVQATPLSPNQIQVSARRAGVTTLNMWDETGKVYAVDVVVLPDARELQQLLQIEFPDAQLRVRQLSQSVVISGHVPSANMVHQVVLMAEDYYPKVINNITVAGSQTILLHTKVMEVSRTKMRALGFDWAHLASGGSAFVQTASGILGTSTAALAGGNPIGNRTETLAFRVVDGGDSFFGFMEALEQNNLVKVLAEPTLVTVSGRPASFNSGGEFPIIVPQSLGTVSVQFRQFGTRVDYVPHVLGCNQVRLEVRPQVSEIDPARSVTINGVTVPGLRTRWVDTGVVMRAGQTLALAGLIQSRTEAEKRGLPFVSDLPWVGVAFRRVQETVNEVELLITVTPEFVDGMNPDEVPPVGPGMNTASPSNSELYFRGYLETPNCCVPGAGYDSMQGGEIVPGDALHGASIEPAQAKGNARPRSKMVNTRPDSHTESAPRHSARISAPSKGSPSRVTRPNGSEPTIIGPVGYDSLR